MNKKIVVLTIVPLVLLILLWFPLPMGLPGMDGESGTALAAANNDGLTDTQARSVVIESTPPAGAIPTRGKPLHEHLNFTKYGTTLQKLFAWAKNLDKTQKTLVRVDLVIWSLTHDLLLGAVTTPDQWIPPEEQALFKGELDMLDPKWGFVGRLSPIVEFMVCVDVSYVDYFIDDTPHWAHVEDAPEVKFTFIFSESPPVPVSKYNQTAPLTVFFDSAGSYDPDEKWGDFLIHNWLVLDANSDIVANVFGDTATVVFAEAGTYQVRHRVTDMFEIRSAQWFSIEVTGQS